MKQLTQKEEEIMERMWDHGPMLVREFASIGVWRFHHTEIIVTRAAV